MSRTIVTITVTTRWSVWNRVCAIASVSHSVAADIKCLAAGYTTLGMYSSGNGESYLPVHSGPHHQDTEYGMVAFSGNGPPAPLQMAHGYQMQYQQQYAPAPAPSAAPAPGALHPGYAHAPPTWQPNPTAQLHPNGQHDRPASGEAPYSIQQWQQLAGSPVQTQHAVQASPTPGTAPLPPASLSGPHVGMQSAPAALDLYGRSYAPMHLASSPTMVDEHQRARAGMEAPRHDGHGGLSTPAIALRIAEQLAQIFPVREDISTIG